MAESSNKRHPAVWFLAGSFLGAAIALLFAPQSGKETRHELKRLGRRAITEAERYQQDMRNSLCDFMVDMETAAHSALQSGSDLTRETRDEILATLETGKHFLEEEKERWTKAFFK